MGTWLAKLLPSEGGSFLEEGIGGNPGPRMRCGAEMPHQPTLSPLLCHDGSDSCSYLNPSLGNFAAAACNTACTGQKKKRTEPGWNQDPPYSLSKRPCSGFREKNGAVWASLQHQLSASGGPAEAKDGSWVAHLFLIPAL